MRLSAALLLPVLAACVSTGGTAVSVPSPAAGCPVGDPLDGVWQPQRLKVLSVCQEVRGTVLSVLQEEDGDYHIWLSVDTGYEKLLNAANLHEGQPALLLEIIPSCTGHPPDQAAAARCPSTRLTVPRRGEHVRALGRWVLDAEHGWNELHPVVMVATV